MITKSNKRATVTVFLLCVLFCSLNAPLIVILLLSLLGYDMPSLIGWALLWIAAPLNSALNPIVYFYRKKQMRAYAKQSWTRLTQRGGRRRAAQIGDSKNSKGDKSDGSVRGVMRRRSTNTEALNLWAMFVNFYYFMSKQCFSFNNAMFFVNLFWYKTIFSLCQYLPLKDLVDRWLIPAFSKSG